MPFPAQTPAAGRAAAALALVLAILLHAASLAQPQVVTSPEATTVWVTNSQRKVAYSGFSASTLYVSLFRQLDAANRALVLRSNPFGPVLSQATANTGEFTWTVASDLPSDTDYLILVSEAQVIYDQGPPVTSTFNGSQPHAFSAIFEIDASGTIPPYVESPVAGEIWDPGSSQVISWGGTFNPADNIYLRLSYTADPSNPSARTALSCTSFLCATLDPGTTNYTYTVPSQLSRARLADGRGIFELGLQVHVSDANIVSAFGSVPAGKHQAISEQFRIPGLDSSGEGGSASKLRPKSDCPFSSPSRHSGTDARPERGGLDRDDVHHYLAGREL